MVVKCPKMGGNTSNTVTVSMGGVLKKEDNKVATGQHTGWQ